MSNDMSIKYVDCYFCGRSIVDYLLEPIPVKNITRYGCVKCKIYASKGYIFDKKFRKWKNGDEFIVVRKVRKSKVVSGKELAFLRARFGGERRALTLNHKR